MTAKVLLNTDEWLQILVHLPPVRYQRMKRCCSFFKTNPSEQIEHDYWRTQLDLDHTKQFTATQLRKAWTELNKLRKQDVQTPGVCNSLTFFFFLLLFNNLNIFSRFGSD